MQAIWCVVWSRDDVHCAAAQRKATTIVEHQQVSLSHQRKEETCMTECMHVDSQSTTMPLCLLVTALCCRRCCCKSRIPFFKVLCAQLIHLIRGRTG